MNQTTEGVTLWAAFILDILREVKKLEFDISELEKICENYDLSSPYNLVPIDVYNEMCAWVENYLGDEVIVRIGNNVGATVYNSLKENTIIHEESEPVEIMESLIVAAESMIHDPEERGWEIIKCNNNSIQMRRTQTFNSRLQFGLLEGLIGKSPQVKDIHVSYVKEVAKGDEFDEYLVQWFN